MTEDILQSPTPPGPPSDRRRIALAAVGGGLAVILLGAGALIVSGVASADNASPQPDPSASGDSSAAGHGPDQPGGPGRDSFGGLGGLAGLGGFGLGGAFGLQGIGPDDALHGTAVVRSADGTFQTVAAQRGTVTEVSPTSISVKSDDGYTATYVVDKDTVVNGPDGKIADIKSGADVAVTATVAGDTSTAKHVIDLASIQDRLHQLMDRFKLHMEHPLQGGDRPGGAPTPSAKASGASA